jgi:hypothetical protein
MTCPEFDRWLDEGQPKRDLARMTLHAAGCTRCQHELAAAAEIEHVLGVVVPAAVSAGFNDAVMRQIHKRGPGIFVQVMAEPVVPVSLGIATIVASQHGRFAAMANDVALAIGSAGMSMGLALTLASLTGWVSWRLFRFLRETLMPTP